MSLTKEAILNRLRQVKGPDLESNIVDLGLVSEVLIKDGRVSFAITVPDQELQMENFASFGAVLGMITRSREVGSST